MVTLPGALAICDESPVAAQALELGVHYLIGITNATGEDEAWNEGPGYGNGKMKWLTDATCYLQTAIPELNLPKNEAYRAYGDFFARLTPLGARHSSFGNRGYEERDWTGSRVTNFRRVAMLRAKKRRCGSTASTSIASGPTVLPTTPTARNAIGTRTSSATAGKSRPPAASGRTCSTSM